MESHPSRSLISLMTLAALLAIASPAWAFSASVDAGVQAGASSAHAAADVCGGSAPAETVCTIVVDRQTALGFRVDSWGAAALGTYTGTLTSRVEWATGFWQSTCNYQNGLADGCERTGSTLGMPTEVGLTCTSLDLRSSTPGGQGLWECNTAHT